MAGNQPDENAAVVVPMHVYYMRSIFYKFTHATFQRIGQSWSILFYTETCHGIVVRVSYLFCSIFP